jgi:hypothetical protein
VDSRRPVWLVALLLTLTASAASAKPKIYVLAVKESQASWTTPDYITARMQQFLKSAADDLGLSFDVEVVDSIEKWEKLMNDPPLNAVVINAHGEAIPVPPKYGTDWQSFYRDLAMNIVYKGWVFVNPIGYGFYYVNYNYTRRPDGGWDWVYYTVGASGLDVLGGWLGIVATAWPQAAGGSPKLTDLGKHVFGVLGYDMPETANAPRPITTNVPASWYFYVLQAGNATAYACVAFNIGKGALLWGGWASSPMDDQARVAVAMALYHLFPSEIQAAQPKAKGLRPEQLLIIGWGAVAAALALVLLMVARKRS